MSLVGSIEAFDINHENWSEYIERIKQYFIANDIDAENKKKGTLLTVIGSETYSLVRNLVFPTKLCDKTYKQLVKALKKHLNPKPIRIAERYKFHQRKQQTGEPLNKYLSELRKMSEHCEFCDFLNDASFVV